MEVKINREIKEFTENVYFGLSLRQFIFSVLGCLVAIGIYFGLRNFVGIETLSWVCILGAMPFAIIGFVNINGMTAEKYLKAIIKSEILTPKRLLFKPVDYFNGGVKK